MNQVFHLTQRTFALVNLKPVLPGHVLVCPRRLVKRVADLTPPEAGELFLTVQRVGRMIERVHGASSLNITIQDGPESGQSVAHVHAHIIPRKKQDMDHLEHGHQPGPERERRTSLPVIEDEERKPRAMEDMEEEARFLAKEMEKEPVDEMNERLKN